MALVALQFIEPGGVSPSGLEAVERLAPRHFCVCMVNLGRGAGWHPNLVFVYIDFTFYPTRELGGNRDMPCLSFVQTQYFRHTRWADCALATPAFENVAACPLYDRDAWGDGRCFAVDHTRMVHGHF